MAISMHLGCRVLGAMALLLGLACAGAAQAVPIYTYTFTQTGYVPVPAVVGAATTGVVTGSFSGALDSSGHITRDTLTAYHFEISGFTQGLDDFNWSHDTLPFLFSYIPGDSGSFGLVDHGYNFVTVSLDVCIGLPAGILCNGGNARGALAAAFGSTGSPIFNAIILHAYTDSVPLLVGSVADVGDPVFLATTPIPAALLLFMTGVGSFPLLAFLRRRTQPRGSAA
jgi:hypothetical protein